MIISKTMFKNFIRCSRYCALDDIHKNKQKSLVTVDNKELRVQDDVRKSKVKELIEQMFNDDGDSKINVSSEHLEVMMPYFNRLEVIAGERIAEKFGNNVIYSLDNYEQKHYTSQIDDYLYQCYVDGYQENEDGSFNIFEVKATTATKFINVGKAYKDTKGKKLFNHINSIFRYDNGILKLREDIEGFATFDDHLKEKDYIKHRAKLLDKYNTVGKYVYDLAIQRYFIESHYKQINKTDVLEKSKYYLVVLNPEYVFDGTYKDGIEDYSLDENGNSIITFIDLTSITKDMQAYIDLDRKRIEGYLDDLDAKPVPIGEFCERKKTTECKYKNEVCWTFIPEKNSILTYLQNHHGFKDENNTKYERYELLNSGKVHMKDIPIPFLSRRNNIIQRNVIDTGKPFLNKSKVKVGLKQITYPIYHLDFETFPCPLPRFKGERAYQQSLFQYSLHIEKEINVCDKEINHYEFLAKDHNDRRYELMTHLINNIDLDSGGTILVYNASFERTRLREMADLFPDLRTSIYKMIDMLFDLMDIVKTRSTLYEELGFSKEEAKEVNYYHVDLNGSYSIKKVLPLFSNLTYNGMEVSNGMEAVYTYASYNKLGNELEYKQKALVEYCKQDTWAMFEVLKGLRKLI